MEVPVLGIVEFDLKAVDLGVINVILIQHSRGSQPWLYIKISWGTFEIYLFKGPTPRDFNGICPSKASTLLVFHIYPCDSIM